MNEKLYKKFVIFAAICSGLGLFSLITLNLAMPGKDTYLYIIPIVLITIGGLISIWFKFFFDIIPEWIGLVLAILSLILVFICSQIVNYFGLGDIHNMYMIIGVAMTIPIKIFEIPIGNGILFLVGLFHRNVREKHPCVKKDKMEEK